MSKVLSITKRYIYIYPEKKNSLDIYLLFIVDIRDHPAMSECLIIKQKTTKK